jgi:hypothetical protein
VKRLAKEIGITKKILRKSSWEEMKSPKMFFKYPESTNLLCPKPKFVEKELPTVCNW